MKSTAFSASPILTQHTGMKLHLQTPAANVVTILCDTGERYLSVHQSPR